MKDTIDDPVSQRRDTASGLRTAAADAPARAPNRAPPQMVEDAVRAAVVAVARIYHPRATLDDVQKDSIRQAIEGAVETVLNRFPGKLPDFQLPLPGAAQGGPTGTAEKLREWLKGGLQSELPDAWTVTVEPVEGYSAVWGSVPTRVVIQDEEKKTVVGPIDWGEEFIQSLGREDLERMCRDAREVTP